MQCDALWIAEYLNFEENCLSYFFEGKTLVFINKIDYWLMKLGEVIIQIGSDLSIDGVRSKIQKMIKSPF